MTNKVTFYDTTMRDGEQTIGVNFSVEEKIAIAKGLDDYGVSAIEAGFPAASQKDFEAVKSIAEVVNKAKVVGLARLVRNDINAVIEATKGAKHPMIHVFIATSPIHREFKLHLTKEEILDKIKADVAFTKQYIQDIVFSPEDATRTEPDFLVASVQTAIDAGATMINIPDTVGYDTPEEYGEVFENLRRNIVGFDTVGWSTHTHNDLGMATANALAGIAHGATEIQGTINGIGERAGNVDMIEAAAAIYVRHEKFNVETDIVLSHSKAISDIVARATQMPVASNKPIMGRNAFAHESGIHQDGYLKNPETYEILKPEMVGATASLPLGKLSGSHAVMSKLNSLGYDVTRDDMKNIFPIFKSVAEESNLVTNEQLKIIMQVVEEKEMVSYQ
ncbi:MULTISPECIES: 2-isopropylmalate synthase [Leuconostoc gelidum group]|uniref:2-isopropylmalate synthase n=1 Tax=Leuconostoc gelidum group TaxID=3016637 RepID=UPI000744C25D|nr:MULTISPECIES: 2-isopropylmalate synthase [Leuconostoc gelidum group]MBR2276779.1 2-isopropylmalate synthase [Leuconostoc sp.]MBZ5943790.1 2-isopropylmalate synthase [Leuconostoc gasicomitatum]MBZ5946225.1 2-isopropylmalate synthase [Leuconostoc gasicomitatum]MBZ5950308.1 2-isopropylmalate synthase [Leuconostoc gasicomitatum]MBZ5951777.1 2-isopropylmalate synthase [Leuconostoc gasicomitatum]